MTKVSSNRPSGRTPSSSAVDAVHKAKESKDSKKSSRTPSIRDDYRHGGTPDLKPPDKDSRLSRETLRSNLARGLGGTSETKAVNFEKMSQDQKYDYLQKMTVDRAGGDASAWKTGDREVNLVGIRSFDGKPRGAEFNRYDDRIYVARMVDGKKTVEGFPASVDPGKQDGDTAYKLGDGFYKDAWTRGNVTGGELGLRQSRDLGVARSNDLLARTGMRAPGGEEMLGVDKQLQFHRGGTGDVNRASRGCQVIRGDHYERFQKILAEAPGSQRDFSYNLADSSTLPGLHRDGSVERTRKLRGHTGKRGTSDRRGGIGIIRTPNKRVVW